MDQFNAELFRQITSDAAVVSLMGKRLHPSRGFQGDAIPYALYKRGGVKATYTHQQQKNIAEVTVKIFVYGSTADQARELANAIKQALDSWSSPAVQRAFIGLDEEEDSDAEDYVPEAKLFVVKVKAKVWSPLAAP